MTAPAQLHDFVSGTLALVATLLVALCTLSTAAQAQEGIGTVRDAADADAPLGLTVDEAYGQELFFDYGSFPSGTRFTMDVTVNPDEITWHELWEGGRLETDPTESVQLDEHRLLMSFTELDGSYIVVYADFMNGETSFCGFFTPGESDSKGCFTGTMTMNK
jgi:hypothetical protein